MALKFLNKKGWHTGSLRNIENVWKAEQKHEAEQKKLEELRLQIQQERERSEFRALQEQAGLVPRQERLEFLYDSGLQVGKGSSSSSGAGVAFQALEEPAKANASSSGSNEQQQQQAVPGALFEDKPHTANDAWRKLHSDPLLLIRQREQQALARIKNNPVQMALIRKSVEEKKPKDKDGGKELKEKHRHRKSRHRKHSSPRRHSDSEDSAGEDNRRKSRDYVKRDKRMRSDLEVDTRKKESHKETRPKEKYRDRSPTRHLEREYEKQSSKGHRSSDFDRKDKEYGRSQVNSGSAHDDEPRHKRRNVAPKLSEEERAARLRQMQTDAELHEEQRWKRLKKAEEFDAQEAKQNSIGAGKNFLHAAQKSVYGAGKGGSSTIEESVRRRTHYLQRGSEAEGNAFRR